MLFTFLTIRLFVIILLFGDINTFSLTTDYDQIPILVGDTSVAGPWVWPNRAFEFQLLPDSNKFRATILLNYPHTIQIVEELFTAALATIYENFVIYQTRAM